MTTSMHIPFPRFLHSLVLTSTVRLKDEDLSENVNINDTVRRSPVSHFPFKGCLKKKILKEISPEYSLEGLMRKLKLQYFGHLIRRTDSFEKTVDAGKDWRQEEKGTTEDEMVGWHHWLNGHEFEQVPGDNEGPGSLACCSPWGRKEQDIT